MSGLEPGGELPPRWKIKAATFVHALLLALLSLGAALLPATGSAQSSDIQTWQTLIKQTQPPQQGCFQASYPDMQWQQVFCAQPQGAIPPWRPPVWNDNAQATPPTPVGNYGYSASAVGGPIWAAEGSFLNVSGVTSMMDSAYGQNTYSLQINTDYLKIPASSSICGNANGCTGWVQFVYQNYAKSNVGYLAIWYWVSGANSCQASWTSFGGWCYYDAGITIPVGAQPLSSFNSNINLSGRSVNGVDAIAVTIGGQAYAASFSSSIKELSQLWQIAQFNVFGLGNYASINFNNGSSWTINTKIDNGTTNAPNCSESVGTGESNNLYYNSPCCRYAGGKPSIAFAEGTDNNANKYTCAALGSNTITPVVTPAGSGTIAPSVALQVPNGAVSTFTVTPSANNKIDSVTGCGGSLNGNVFTTAPASGNCTVTASFSGGGGGYTISTSAGTGGTISPTSITGVASGTTRSLTVTPNQGYYIASISGCGGTPVTGNSTYTTARNYTTGAVTGNCTVTAQFAQGTTSYTVTGYAYAGGTISPASALVNSGSTYTFTITPNSGYYISYIWGCNGTQFNGSSTNTTARTYTTGAVTGNCTVAAQFAPGTSTYTVSTNAGTGGTISPASAQVQSGATQTFTVTPNSGYYINQITGCSGTTFTGNSSNTTARTFTTGAVTGNCTVSASFSPATPSYTVSTYAYAGGTISPASAQVQSGQTYTFTVTPNPGYYITFIWGCNGTQFNGNTSSTTARTFTTGAVTGNCTVAAYFTPGASTYTVSTNAGTGGTISPASAQVQSGATQTFTVTPNAGYYINQITGCSGTTFTGNRSNTTARTFTTGAVTGNCTVSASFSPATTGYTVSTYAYAGGTISPASAQVQSGQTYTFTVTPNPGYYIAFIWGCNGTQFNGNTSSTTARTFTTGAVTGNCTVAAYFTPGTSTYTVSTYAYAGGTISPASAQVQSGATQTFTVTPNSGYYISYIWGCNGTQFNGNTSSTTARTFTTGAVTGNCQVFASFGTVPR